jgi:hypothetical protein
MWEENIKLVFENQTGVEWTGFIWLRIGTNGEFL